MRTLYITRAGVIGTIVALGVAGACVRLGVWQLDRLEQRRARNRAVAERLHAEPVILADAGADTTGLLHRSAVLQGAFDHARSIVLAGRSHLGRSGAHLVTPLRLEGGGAVLVDRGWLPTIDPIALDLSPYRVDGTVRVDAVLLPFPESAAGAAGGGDLGSSRPDERTAGSRGADAAPARVRFRLEFAAIAAGSPYPLFAAYARALPAGDAAPGLPRALPPPALDDGPHLGYALQWFSFAAIALIGWTTLALRRGEIGRRDDATAPSSSRGSGSPRASTRSSGPSAR